MKKFITTVMLFLFLLNVVGFYGIFLGIQFKNTQEANRHLDANQFSGSDLITFKIPLSIPYYSDNQEFERISGEFEHGGEMFRLLKQKYAGDTLTLVCVRDHAAKEFDQALTDYVKTFSDKPVNAKQQSAKSLSSFCKDYITTLVGVESQSTGWHKLLASTDLVHHSFSYHHSRLEYPPRLPFSI